MSFLRNEQKHYDLYVRNLDYLLENMKKYTSHPEIGQYLEESFNEKIELLGHRHGKTIDYYRLKNLYNRCKGIEGS